MSFTVTNRSQRPFYKERAEMIYGPFHEVLAPIVPWQRAWRVAERDTFQKN